MPFYRKIYEFSHVFPLNHRYLNQPSFEVILVLDEDSQSSEVLRFIQQFPDVNWRVIVCHQEHAWRPPCKAINVGLRNSRGKFILIVSPESIFVNDVPGHMLKYAHLMSNAAVCGRVSHCHVDEYLASADAYDAMFRDRVRTGAKNRFYGSICVPRDKAVEIGGYDECLTRWGGDDDNFRARLRLAGLSILNTSDIMILHLDFSPKETRVQKTRAEMDALLKPKTKTCARCFPTWGSAFNDIIFDSASSQQNAYQSK